MNDSMVFEYQHHIDLIRKRLWCGREFGQAAVMVGTGFSRNAKKISENIAAFPLWHELSNAFYDSLYYGTHRSGNEESANDAKIRATAANSGTLRLALEYEITFGRQALDNLLIQSIPDNNYLPGHLHELLLSLPWSDVFTTNYDTLLERARPAIFEKKYDLVQTIEDIPGRMKPRIVKLHGSFPSYRPFIITEEDYRTYPRNFAPFVNMVQQSLMENIFCLIGFSGDDPNFLHWAGWVRDNLGVSTPPIYLCGLLGLSSSQRKLLEQKKIIPIDLSQLFPSSKWPDTDLRHVKALEWFLLNLMYGEPVDTGSWPEPARRKIWHKSDDLPPIPGESMSLVDRSKMHPDSKVLEAEDSIDLYNSWYKIRTEYPGWVIMPKKNRDILWRYTEHWMLPIFKSYSKLSPPHDLLLLHELNWRLEKTLTPLVEESFGAFDKILENYNPFPHLLDMNNSSISPDKDGFANLDWKIIQEAWVNLAFALARDYRHQYDRERFRLWMDRLKKVISYQKEWQMRWHYEEILCQLCSLNVGEVYKQIANWPESPDLPIWQIKRASILAELGELKEAEKIAEAALTLIRTRLQPYLIDYSLLSQEGWAMILLGVIKDNISNTEERFFERHRNRFEKLDTYDCDPWVTIKDLRSDIKYPTSYKNLIHEEKGFDPGVITRTRQYHEGFSFGFRQAYSLLRAHEDAGLPIKCGHITMCYDETKQAIKTIMPDYLMWSVSNMVRAGDTGVMKDWFTRVRAATFKKKDVELLFSNLFRALQQIINRSPVYGSSEKNIQLTMIYVVPELLSRLAFRLTKEQLQQLLLLSTKLYKNPIVDTYALYRNLKVLFDRILIAMSHTEQIENLLSLLTLPIPTENGFEPRILNEWVEPVSYIEWPQNFKLNQRDTYSFWNAPIMNLIRITEDGQPIGRQHAIWRLLKIYEIEGLTVGEKDAFGKALWSRIDSSTNLPSDTGLYKWGFLRLPYSEKMDAKVKFKRYVLSLEFPRLISIGTEGEKVKGSRSVTANRDYQLEIMNSTEPIFKLNESKKLAYVDWSAEEAALLLEKAITWWDEEKAGLQKENENKDKYTDDFQTAFSSLVPILSTVIMPRLGKLAANNRDRYKRILLEMESYGIDINSAVPSFLFIDEKYYDEACFKLRSGLNSVEEDAVRSSVTGYYCWIFYSSQGKIKNPPADLLEELLNRIVSRRQPGLLSVLDYMVVILREYPHLFTDKSMETLCIALEYLLKETELSSSQELNAIEKAMSLIPIDDKPEYRTLSSLLAFSIYTFSISNKKEIPMIVNKWKNISLNDPLPEVKRVWS